MKLLKFLSVGLVLAFVVASCDKNDDTNDNGLNATDRNFMMNAAYGNYAEVDAGQLAAAQGEQDSVQLFGGFMVTEHGMAQASLDSIGSMFSMSLPNGPDQEHQNIKAYLQTLSGYTFDTAYINQQIVDHQKTVSLFTDEINNGARQEVKDYASRYLPHIQMHLQMAQSIKAKL